VFFALSSSLVLEIVLGDVVPVAQAVLHDALD
jgi:hypothetical protein